MSQVDYLHFFNNIIWNLIQLIIMYVFISVVYVQNFYKIFRFRLLNYNILSNFLKDKDNNINKNFDKFKKVRKIFNKIVKFLNFNINKIKKWVYE